MGKCFNVKNTKGYRQLPAFQSVILAGVYDVKNLKRKFVPENGHKVNSPWNIAADFHAKIGDSGTVTVANRIFEMRL